jgi:hypothetical protein
MNEAETREALRKKISTIAETCGVSRTCVSFSFAVFSEEDEGALWSLVVHAPPADKRKRHFDRISGSGATLAEAEEDFAVRWATHLAFEAGEAARRRRK